MESKLHDLEGVEDLPTLWSNLFPKIVSIFIWRVRAGSIPVRMQLDQRGVDIPYLLCPTCNDCLESIDHVLLRCRVSSSVWDKVFAWWGLEDQNCVDVNKLPMFKGKKYWKKEPKDIWEAVVWSFLYLLWSHRNTILFERKKSSVEVMFSKLQSSMEIVSLAKIEIQGRQVELDYMVC